MKRQTKPPVLIHSALALALAICTPIQAQPAAGKAPPDKMMECCRDMREQKQQMMETAKAQDAALAEQIAKMNAAPADKKTELMAAALTLMAEQRAAMHARKAKMDETMTQHLMQHMRMGRKSMADCPLMKGMTDDMGEKPADSDKEHHGE